MKAFIKQHFPEINFEIDDTTLGLLSALNNFDTETSAHSLRVCIKTEEITCRLGITQHRTLLRRTALLHDIGKTRIDPSILFKTEKLTETEIEHIAKHQVFSREILADYFSAEADLAGEHHNGNNTFDKYHIVLDNRKMPLVEIIRFADIYDALKNDRVYRQAVPTNLLRSSMQQFGQEGKFSISLLNFF